MINRSLFLILILTFGITLFTRNDFRRVTGIMPEVLNEPVQKEASGPTIIKFAKDGYNYELTPLYDYEISGLIVGKMDYRLFSISRTDSVFPMDIGLIWGNNVRNGVHRDRRIRFTEDGRWIWVQWQGDVNFDFNSISNNHLLLNDRISKRELKILNLGDQVTVTGKLVNVKGYPSGGSGLEPFTWNTSTTRTDTGAGACEVVYVENIKILKKANPVSFYLFRFSFYGLIALFLGNLAWIAVKEK